MKLVYTGWNEIEQALGFDERTLREMARDEGLPLVFIRRKPWLSITALDAWLLEKSCQVQS